MPIRVTCANGHKLLVPDNRSGSTVACPKCADNVSVPGAPSGQGMLKTSMLEPTAMPPKPAPNATMKRETLEDADSRRPKKPTTNPLKTSMLMMEPMERPPAKARPAPPVTAAPASIAPPERSRAPAPPPPIAPPAITSPPVESRWKVDDQTPAFVPAPVAPPTIEPPPIAPSVEPSVESTVVEPPPPAFETTEPALKLPGRIPTAAKREEALHLAIGLLVVAITGMVPALWEWFVLWQNPEGPITPSWVYILILASLVQIGYAIYLAEIPDFSALWTVTAVTLLYAAVYAALLGLTVLRREENQIAVLFGFSDKLAGNRAAMWCFVMVCFLSVLSYFLGLAGVHWYRAHCMRRRYGNS